MPGRESVPARAARAWRTREDRWLAPVAAFEARVAGTRRPGTRIVPSPSLRWTFRGAVVLVGVLLASFALPPVARRPLLLALFFLVILGGLWALARDARA